MHLKLNTMENQSTGSDEIRIDLSEEIAQGTYSNLVVVTHSPTEFVLDFVRMMPGTPSAKVKSRIILTPDHAKRFMRTLQDNIKKYESMHGEIEDPLQRMEGVLPINFGGNTPLA